MLVSHAYPNCPEVINIKIINGTPPMSGSHEGIIVLWLNSIKVGSTSSPAPAVPVFLCQGRHVLTTVALPLPNVTDGWTSSRPPLEELEMWLRLDCPRPPEWNRYCILACQGSLLLTPSVPVFSSGTPLCKTPFLTSGNEIANKKCGRPPVM